ncbi:fibronectin type III domain-containing protein [Cohnella nanjingensis]|uniref:S-layer homology domain-containing protein n=1 Tax=Cohnella nanjingensis TaxID=1387779 RepID=A0A7X0RM90_9BACL|nr:S-layer homology domain-containing protein [Cohnella nanjingensis]MBB6670040.1 S-layer homology domain-containing protein [Cohnella nanjingensis]
MIRKKTVSTKLLIYVLVICFLSVGFPKPSSASYTFTKSDIIDSMNAFLDAHYDEGNIVGSHFWEAAYSREALVQFYNATGLNKDKITETYNWFEATHTRDRFGNPLSWIENDGDWNDDYSWQAQFTMSAYEATQDQHMLDQAKWHFDFFYSNNVDDKYGGGMWRERSARNQKDVPTNGWAIVATELSKYYPSVKVHNNLMNTDKTYLEIAEDIYDWMKTSFMRPDGGIENSFSDGHLFWDDNLYTYNAGIFIELASNLYSLTHKETYLQDAVKAADFARVHFTNGVKQIVVYEDDVGGQGLYKPDPAGNAEIVFRGILMRGIYKLITLGHQTQYIDWLSNNAQAAFNNRSVENLTAPNWDTPYDGSDVRSTANATGLTLMAYSLMTSEQPQQLSGRVEAENAIKTGSAERRADPFASGQYYVANLNSDGAAIEFDHSIESQHLVIGYSSGMDNSKLGLYINGGRIADVHLPKTAGWSGVGAYEEVTLDINIPNDASVKLQFDQASGDVAANVDYIKLVSSLKPDKSGLEEDLNHAMNLDQTAYTAETWATLQPAIDAAVVVYNNANATQSDVDTAVGNLDAVVHALVRFKFTGKVEAELAKKYGTAYSQSDSYASGGLLAGSIDHVGSAIEFENVAAASKLLVSYASGSNNPHLSLYINGQYVQDLTFTNTGGWTGQGRYAQKTFDIDIPDGATLKIQYDTGDIAANIDYIGLTSADDSELAALIANVKNYDRLDYVPESWTALQAGLIAATNVIQAVPSQEQVDTALTSLQNVVANLQMFTGRYSGKIEAEIGKTYGTAYSQADQYASGAFLVGSIDHVGSAFEIKHSAATDKLVVSYASNSNNPHLSMYINGVYVQDLYFTKTGKWTGNGAYAQKTFDVSIPDGATFKLQFDADDVATNVDYIVISANKADLEQKIASAQAFEQQDYSQATWSALQEALTAAINVDGDQNVSQGDVDTALANLNTAILALEAPITTPEAPTGLSASAAGASVVNLSWTAVTGAEAYNVYVSDSENGIYTKLTTSPVTRTDYSHTGLSPETTYYYKVTAVNEAGESEQSAVASATTAPAPAGAPEAPTGLSAAAAGASVVNLSWTAVTGAEAYNVYSSDSEDGIYTKLTDFSVTGTVYSHMGLSPATTYYYKVTAVNGVGESEQSAVASVTTAPTPVEAPEAPTGLSATAAGTNGINLSWTAATGAEAYNVYGSASENGTYTKLTDSAVTGTVYSHTGLSPATTYYYKVTAVNGAGESEQSAVASATTDRVSGGGTTTPPVINPPVTKDPHAPVVDSSGVATMTIDQETITKAIQASNTAEIIVPKADGANAYVVKLPAGTFASGDSSKKIKVTTELGTVTVAGNTLGTDLGGVEQVNVSIAKADTNKLEKSVQAVVGNRPVVDINVYVNDSRKAWQNNESPITVEIPYSPTAAELADPEHIVVLRIGNDGGAVPVPTGKYDPATGMVTFKTTQSGQYAVALANKSFSDLNGYSWANHAIEIMASKGVINGTSANSFNPAAAIKRADFILMLVKALGLTANGDDNFADVSSGAYYAEALGIAKQIGVATGVGDNKFNPEAQISRQDMMVLVDRAMNAVQKHLVEGSNADLNQFRDKTSVAAYAEQSVATLIKNGIITGSNEKVNPQGNTTRAETAVIIYRIYNK